MYDFGIFIFIYTTVRYAWPKACLFQNSEDFFTRDVPDRTGGISERLITHPLSSLDVCSGK